MTAPLTPWNVLPPTMLGDSGTARQALADCAREDNQGFAGATRAEVRRRLIDGDTAAAARIAPMLERAAAKLEVEAEAYARRPDVVGAAPSVGAYLAGSPMAMRRRYVDADATAPVRVFLGISPLWSVKPSTVENLATAALAVCVATAAVRPLALYIGHATCTPGTGSKGHPAIVHAWAELGLAPWDLSVAGPMIADGAVRRCAWFGAMDAEERRHGVNCGAHPMLRAYDTGKYDGRSDRLAALRAALLAPRDVLLWIETREDLTPDQALAVVRENWARSIAENEAHAAAQ